MDTVESVDKREGDFAINGKIPDKHWEKLRTEKRGEKGHIHKLFAAPPGKKFVDMWKN